MSESVHQPTDVGGVRWCFPCHMPYPCDARNLEDNAATIATLQAQLAERDQMLGDLLATIFGDGGHRRSEIGDDAEACRQAIEVYHAKRQADDERAYRAETERDNALAREQRLREALKRVLEAHELPDEPGIDMDLFRSREREIARERMSAATPADAAASQRREAEDGLLEALTTARTGFRKLVSHHRDDHHRESEMPHDETVATGLLVLERSIAELRRARGESWDDILRDATLDAAEPTP